MILAFSRLHPQLKPLKARHGLLLVTGLSRFDGSTIKLFKWVFKVGGSLEELPSLFYSSLPLSQYWVILILTTRQVLATRINQLNTWTV